MQPANRMMIRHGHSNFECRVDCSGNDDEIVRMILFYRGLGVRPSGSICPVTIADEPDKENFRHCSRPVDSPNMNPTAPGPAFRSIKTDARRMTEQKNIQSGEIQKNLKEFKGVER
jgi:hypothetical protein